MKNFDYAGSRQRLLREFSLRLRELPRHYPGHLVPPPFPNSNTVGAYMKRLFLLGTALLAFAATTAAQDKVFDWIRASDENAQLDPMAGAMLAPAVRLRAYCVFDGRAVG